MAEQPVREAKDIDLGITGRKHRRGERKRVRPFDIGRIKKLYGKTKPSPALILEPQFRYIRFLAGEIQAVPSLEPTITASQTDHFLDLVNRFQAETICATA